MNRRRLAAAAVIALAGSTVLSACGPKNSLKLDLRSVAITVPRLVTPAVQLVPPAAAPIISTPPAPPLEELLPEPSPAPVPVVAPSCPAANPFATPEKPAAVTVLAPPAEGTVTQTSTGAFANPNGNPATGALAAPLTTTVKHLPSTTTSSGQKISSWSVERHDAAGTSIQLEVYQLVSPGGLTDTAGGIYLVGLAWKDPIRGELTFRPVGGGLFILPSPVSQAAATGVQYVGVATDPATLTTMQLIRNVTGKKVIDLCGNPVDTYTVSMSGVLTSLDVQQQVSWTQQLATAYGGANIEDTLTLTSPLSGFSWTRTLRNEKLVGAK